MKFHEAAWSFLVALALCASEMPNKASIKYIWQVRKWTGFLFDKHYLSRVFAWEVCQPLQKGVAMSWADCIYDKKNKEIDNSTNKNLTISTPATFYGKFVENPYVSATGFAVIGVASCQCSSKVQQISTMHILTSLATEISQSPLLPKYVCWFVSLW